MRGGLLRIVAPGSGSVVTRRRAQMVLLSAQRMDVAAIARVAFTSEDRRARYSCPCYGWELRLDRWHPGRSPRLVGTWADRLAHELTC